MKKNCVTIMMVILGFSFSSSANVELKGPASPGLISAARAEIARGSRETACSIYVKRVLNRAGYGVQSFRANDFGSQAKRYMSSWSVKPFYAGSSGRASLRAFLNSFPNNTAFVAQWIRSGRSGHIAVVVKEAPNLYRIYQAQQGLSRPHSKQTSIDGLLYARNSYGDRSNMRLYFQ